MTLDSMTIEALKALRLRYNLTFLVSIAACIICQIYLIGLLIDPIMVTQTLSIIIVITLIIVLAAFGWEYGAMSSFEKISLDYDYEKIASSINEDSTQIDVNESLRYITREMEFRANFKSISARPLVIAVSVILVGVGMLDMTWGLLNENVPLLLIFSAPLVVGSVIFGLPVIFLIEAAVAIYMTKQVYVIDGQITQTGRLLLRTAATRRKSHTN